MSEGAAPSNFLDQDLVPDLESSLLSLLSEMHFAISVVSALQVLHVLLMPSSAVTAQPEPEEGCLLQSPGQLALKAEQVVPAGRINDLQTFAPGKLVAPVQARQAGQQTSTSKDAAAIVSLTRLSPSCRQTDSALAAGQGRPKINQVHH